MKSFESPHLYEDKRGKDKTAVIKLGKTQKTPDDKYLEGLEKRLNADEGLRERETLLERLNDRLDEVNAAIDRAKASYKEAASFNERMGATAEQIRLEDMVERLHSLFETTLKPTREQIATGDMKLTKEERKLLDEELPVLLTKGRRPVLLDTEKLSNEEVDALTVRENKDDIEAYAQTLPKDERIKYYQQAFDHIRDEELRANDDVGKHPSDKRLRERLRMLRQSYRFIENKIGELKRRQNMGVAKTVSMKRSEAAE